MGKAYFVTGTDTDIGKTLVASSLLHIAQLRGQSTLGLKPVAAGCEHIGGAWMNDDARLLQQLSSIEPDYATVNPVALREPMAPHIAAAHEAVALTADALAQHCKPLLAAAEFVVVEGAGGWQVPLNETETMATLAVELDCPVIMVVGMRLGCINHALLTATAIEQQGLRLAGWVANHIDPGMAVADENVTALTARLPAPRIGRIPLLSDCSPAAAARYLQPEHLA